MKLHLMGESKKDNWLESIRKNWKLVIVVVIIAWVVASVIMPVISPVITDIIFYNTETDVGEPLTIITLEGFNETPPMQYSGHISVEFIPIKSFNDFNYGIPWPCIPSGYEIPEDEKLYIIVLLNNGDGIAEDIYIRFSSRGHLIKSIQIEQKNRINIVGGGEKSDFVNFKIDELMPLEIHDIKMYIEGRENIEGIIDAWSLSEGKILAVSQYDFVLTYHP